MGRAKELGGDYPVTDRYSSVVGPKVSGQCGNLVFVWRATDFSFPRFACEQKMQCIKSK